MHLRLVIQALRVFPQHLQTPTQAAVFAKNFPPQRQEAIAYRIAAEGAICICGVLPPIIDPLLTQPIFNVRTTQRQQRTQQPDAANDGVRPHATQAGAVCATRKPQKEVLQLVVAVMGKEDGPAETPPCIQPQATARLLAAFPRKAPRRHLQPFQMEGDATEAAEVLAPLRIVVGAFAAQAVMAVDGGELLARLMQSQKKRGAVGPAAETDQRFIEGAVAQKKPMNDFAQIHPGI